MQIHIDHNCTLLMTVMVTLFHVDSIIYSISYPLRMLAIILPIMTLFVAARNSSTQVFLNKVRRFRTHELIFLPHSGTSCLNFVQISPESSIFNEFLTFFLCFVGICIPLRGAILQF